MYHLIVTALLATVQIQEVQDIGIYAELSECLHAGERAKQEILEHTVHAVVSYECVKE